MHNDISYIDMGTEQNKRSTSVQSILSLVFGMISILLAGPIGIVLGALANKFGSYAVSVKKNDSVARAGEITGTVGFAMSVTSTALLLLVLIVGIWLVVYTLGANV